MFKLPIFLLLIVACFASLIECQHWDNTRQASSGGRGSGGPRAAQPAAFGTNLVYGNSYGALPPTPSVVATQNSPHAQASVSSGGVGAWGYMAIILTVVLSGIAIYYVYLLYPVVCKKERMYDVMEMTAV